MATFDLLMFCFVATSAMAVLIYMLRVKRKEAAAKRDLITVSAAVAGFFRENGEDVAIECVRQPGGNRYVALVDSLPSKRLRYSHIVAELLCNHVRKTCGMELAKVYWRLSMRALADSSPPRGETGAAGRRAPDRDNDLDLGMARTNNVQNYEVTESSWENFKELIERKPAEV
jgi:hypothetical protein